MINQKFPNRDIYFGDPFPPAKAPVFNINRTSIQEIIEKYKLSLSFYFNGSIYIATLTSPVHTTIAQTIMEKKRIITYLQIIGRIIGRIFRTENVNNIQTYGVSKTIALDNLCKELNNYYLDVKIKRKLFNLEIPFLYHTLYVSLQNLKNDKVAFRKNQLEKLL